MTTKSKRHQALKAMRAVEKGANVEDACEKAGVSMAVYYRHRRIEAVAHRAPTTTKALVRAPKYHVMEAEVVEAKPTGKLLLVIGTAAELRAFLGRDL